MKILLIGSTGYVAEKILSDLLNSTHSTRLLIRKESLSKIKEHILSKTEIAYGDVTQAESIKGKLNGCNAVIYLPGLIREFPQKGITFQNVHYHGVKNIVEEAATSGIRRFILMSSNGVRPNASTEYLRTKFRAEEFLKSSGMDWTIFRPSVIFGGNIQKQNFISVITGLLNQMPLFVPIIGNGVYRFQPVSLQNVSEAFLKSLDTPESIGKVYHLCGKEVFSYNQIIDIISNFIGVRKYKLHIPIGLMHTVASLLGKYEWFPVTSDQISMMIEENICKAHISFYQEFKIKPVLFSEYYGRSAMDLPVTMTPSAEVRSNEP